MPTRATVVPGEGGRIEQSWDGEFASSSDIVTWRPGRELETTTAFGDSVVRQRWTLEPLNDSVIVTVEHGPFPDPVFHDAVRRGWTFELRGLRHHLECHSGETREVVFAVGRSSRPFEAIWADVTVRLFQALPSMRLTPPPGGAMEGTGLPDTTRTTGSGLRNSDVPRSSAPAGRSESTRTPADSIEADASPTVECPSRLDHPPTARLGRSDTERVSTDEAPDRRSRPTTSNEDAHPCTVRGPHGPIEAFACVHEPPCDVAAVIPGLRDAYLRVRLDPDWSAPPDSSDGSQSFRTANLWLSTWSIPSTELAQWKAHLETIAAAVEGRQKA